jgi:hypothetical protein
MSQIENHDDELQALLQAMPQPEPSAQLDQAILAQADAALAGKPEAANDETSPFFRPSFVRRYRVPLGLAATVFITANLVLMEPKAPPQVARTAEMAAPSLIMEVRPEAAVKPQLPAPKVVDVPVMAAAPSDQARPEKVEAPVAEVAEAPPAPPPATAPAFAAPAPATVAARAPAADSIYAADARAMAAKVAPVPVELAKSLAASRNKAAPPDPATALEQIIALEKSGDTLHLGTAWRDFKRDFPDYAVDPALRARLDAVPVIEFKN